jgi:hypothetical protein
MLQESPPQLLVCWHEQMLRVQMLTQVLEMLVGCGICQGYLAVL